MKIIRLISAILVLLVIFTLPSAILKAQENYWVLVFNPTGTYFTDSGHLLIRIDFIPLEGSPAYNKHHVYVVDENSLEFKAGPPVRLDINSSKEDQDIYRNWLDSLPHIWRTNPVHSQFISVPVDITTEQLKGLLADLFDSDVLNTIDVVWEGEENKTLTKPVADYISPLMRDKVGILTEPVEPSLQDYYISQINTRLSDFNVIRSSSYSQVPLIPQSIDVGPGAEDLDSSLSSYTMVTIINSANGTGFIDTVELWFVTNGIDVEVATFSDAGSGNLSTSGTASLGTVLAGSKQTLTAPADFTAFDVTVGDYAGVYFSGGSIEFTDSAGSTFYYKGGDYIPCTHIQFNQLGGRKFAIYFTGDTGASAPTIVTNPSASSNSSGAVITGNVTDTGGQNCTVFAYWGETDGSDNWSAWSNNSTVDSPSLPMGVGEFTETITGLYSNTLYYYNFSGNNTGGTGWGDSGNFTTSNTTIPVLTTDEVIEYGDTWFLAEGDIIDSGGANCTAWGFQWKLSSMEVYTDNVTHNGSVGIYHFSDNISGLDPGESYDFRSFAVNPAGIGYSEEGEYESAPTVVTIAASNVEETTATMSANLTDDGGWPSTLVFYYGESDGGENPSSWSSNSTPTSPSQPQNEGVAYYNASGLPPGTTTYFSVRANNPVGSDWGDTLSFLTKPNPATSFTSTDNDTTQINLAWTNGTGMDYVEVRYASGSTAPSDNTSGTLGYWGTSTSCNITGLSEGTQYSFRIFTHATEGGSWTTADNNPACTDITKPDPATGLSVDDEGSTYIAISWTNGTGMDYVEVRYLVGTSAPSENTSGTLAYWGTGTSANLTELNVGTTYSIRVFTHASEGGLWNTADNNPSCNGTTESLPDIPVGVPILSGPEITEGSLDYSLIMMIAVALFSILAFWKEIAILFYINFGLSIMVGLNSTNLLSGNAETTTLGVTIGLCFIAYAFACFAFGIRLTFWRE